MPVSIALMNTDRALGPRNSMPSDGTVTVPLASLLIASLLSIVTGLNMTVVQRDPASGLDDGTAKTNART